MRADQETEQQSIQQIAIEKQLGSFQSSYSSTMQNVIGFAVFLLFSALILFAIIESFITGFPLDSPIKFLLVVFSLLFFLFIAYVSYKSRSNKEMLYEHGMILTRWNIKEGRIILQAVRWDQIQHTHAHSSQYGTLYRLKLKDGQTVAVTQRLFNHIKQQIDW
ncbi:hypothetical protein ccbrp13_32250 [Ktedonobacteria bacterium brp13]|nr:hypothetical protein ccbrp13_32250 [Ktedonobacteria bacterium brp13]